MRINSHKTQDFFQSMLTGFIAYEHKEQLSQLEPEESRDFFRIFSDFKEIHPVITLRKLFRFQNVWIFFHRTLSNSFISGTYDAAGLRYPTAWDG